MKKVIIHVVGWAFIIVGIAGLVLPILQGFLFICIGLLILSKELPWADRIITRLKRKYPRFGGTLEKARTYMDNELLKFQTQRGYFWKRLPMLLLALVILAAVSVGMSYLYIWIKSLFKG